VRLVTGCAYYLCKWTRLVVGGESVLCLGVYLFREDVIVECFGDGLFKTDQQLAQSLSITAAKHGRALRAVLRATLLQLGPLAGGGDDLLRLVAKISGHLFVGGKNFLGERLLAVAGGMRRNLRCLRAVVSCFFQLIASMRFAGFRADLRNAGAPPPRIQTWVSWGCFPTSGATTPTIPPSSTFTT
jgi:hypothetical protein